MRPSRAFRRTSRTALRSRLGIAILTCMVLLTACSDPKGYWLKVNVISVQGSTVCMQPVDPRFWQDFPPRGVGCRDGSAIDLSAIRPETCVILRLPNSPKGKISGVGDRC